MTGLMGSMPRGGSSLFPSIGIGSKTNSSENLRWVKLFVDALEKILREM
jgi:hypothetical protein